MYLFLRKEILRADSNLLFLKLFKQSKKNKKWNKIQVSLNSNRVNNYGFRTKGSINLLVSTSKNLFRIEIDINSTNIYERIVKDTGITFDNKKMANKKDTLHIHMESRNFH